MAIIICCTSPDGTQYQPLLYFESFQEWQTASLSSLPMQDCVINYGDQFPGPDGPEMPEKHPWKMGIIFSVDNRRRLDAPHLTEWKIIAEGEDDVHALGDWFCNKMQAQHWREQIAQRLKNLKENYGW